jgi:hypothetical protein
VARCEVNLRVRSVGGEQNGTATYQWDGKRGALAWDEARLGAQMASQGWSANTFDAHFRADRFEKGLAGAKLVTTRTETGAEIAVTGASAGIRKLVFDETGMLARAESVSNVGGKPTDLVLTFRHQKVGEQFAIAGWTVELDLPGVGPFKEVTTFEFRRLGEVLVWASAKAESAMGTRTLTFRWTLDFIENAEEPTGLAEDEPEESGEPGAPAAPDEDG